MNRSARRQEPAKRVPSVWRPPQDERVDAVWSARRPLGFAVGALGSLFAAAGLVGLRGEMVNANVALILVLFVLAGATIGGRVAGVGSAVVAALSFDFFHTRPYNTLKVSSADDVETMLLLLLVGLAAGEIAVAAQRYRDRSGDDQRAIRRLRHVAARAAQGDAVEDLILIVGAELTETLQLRDCYFERPPYLAEFERLERSGTVASVVHRYTHDGFELPAEGVELPVVAGDQTVGRFVLLPTPGVGVSAERRLVAVALADQVGAALASRQAS